jgi:hypothetical protein
VETYWPAPAQSLEFRFISLAPAGPHYTRGSPPMMTKHMIPPEVVMNDIALFESRKQVHAWYVLREAVINACSLAFFFPNRNVVVS